MNRTFFTASNEEESAWWFIPEVYCPIMLDLEKEFNKRLSKGKGLYEAELTKLIDLLIDHQLNHFESLQIKNQSSYNSTRRGIYEKKADKFERDYNLLKETVDVNTILRHFIAYFTYVYPNWEESLQSDKSGRYLKFKVVSKSIANYRVPYVTARIILERLTASHTFYNGGSESSAVSAGSWRHVCESEFYEAMHELIQDDLLPSTDGVIKRSEDMARDLELRRVYKERFEEGIKILQDAGLVKKEGMASYNHGYKRPTYTFVAKNLIGTFFPAYSVASRQDARWIKDIKNAAIQYVEKRRLQRINEKSPDTDWTQFLLDRINSFHLSAVKPDDVDRELSKAIYGKSYSQVEKKRIELHNEKFISELNDINNVKISDADSVNNISLRYKNLLKEKGAVINSNYARGLYSYAEFLMLNQPTAGSPEESDSDREKEILSSIEQAVNLTEANPETLQENTYYLISYTRYLLQRNPFDVNCAEKWFDKILENLSDLSDSIFKVDCLITAGHYFMVKAESQKAWDLISQAEDIIMDRLSVSDNDIATRLAEIHANKALIASVLFGHLSQEIIHEYEEAIKYSEQLSYQDLKTRNCNLDWIYSRYESCLAELPQTEKLNLIYIRHLNFLIKTYNDSPDDERIHNNVVSKFYEWAEFLHFYDLLKLNFNDFNNMLKRVAGLGFTHITDEFYEESDILQLIWNYSDHFDRSYSSHVKFADTLTDLADKQRSLFVGDKIIPVIEKNYNDALPIYEKYSEKEIRCLISSVSTRLSIAALHSTRYGDVNYHDISERYRKLLSDFADLKSKSPYLHLLNLKVLNEFVGFLNRKHFDREVIKSLNDEAFALHNEIIPVLYVDFYDLSEQEIIDFVLFRNSDYNKNEEDMVFYKYTVIKYDNLHCFQYLCGEEIIATYKNLIDFYKQEHREEVIEDDQLNDILNNLISEIFGNKALFDIDEKCVYELIKLCMEAFPDEIEQVRARYNLKQAFVKTNAPQYYHSFLPRNIINEKIESIRWKEYSYDVDVISDWEDLALIYNSLSLYRKEKKAYLNILKIIDQNRKTKDQSIEYVDIEAAELNAIKNLYRIFLQSRRYKIAKEYIDKLISLLEKLREEDKSIHQTVRQYKLERIELEDRLFGDIAAR